MKIKRQHPKRKIHIIILSLLAAGALAAIYFIYSNQINNKETGDEINYSSPVSDQVDAGAQAKKNTVEQDENDSTSVDFSTRIVSASVQSDTLKIRNIIDKVYQQGSCELTLTKGSQTVKKTADIQALPQSSVCKGFDIPVSELSSGTWQVTLTVTIKGQTSEASTTVEVS